MSVIVVVGGTRSGKSAHAERLAGGSGLPVRYVATADDGDPSMADRIRGHVERRPCGWQTVSAGTELAHALSDAAGTCVLLDGLGPWIAACLHEVGAFGGDGDVLRGAQEMILREIDRAVSALGDAGAAIVVCEQAGEGLLPSDAGARAWLDVLGEATQRFAARAQRVDYVVAGRVVPLGAPVGDTPSPALAPDPPPVVTPDPSLRRHGDRDVRPGDADHAVNVIAGGPPDWLRETLDVALETGAHTYPREDEALCALAALHARRRDEVVPTNGGAEALWLLGPALCPALAACVHPAFTEAEAGLHAHGIPVVRVHRDPDAGFALDPDAVPDAADLVVVGNPASPSGTLDPASSILALRRPGRTVVVDEAFMDLVPGQPGSLAGEPLDDVIVVRSLTKVLAVPGLRVGYALAASPLAARLRAVRPPWSANTLALAALCAAAARPDALAAVSQRAALEREDLAQRLGTIDGIRTWHGAANFCLVEVRDGPAVLAALRDRAVAVRPAASFPGLTANHMRLTARSPTENAHLADALACAIGATA